MIGNKSQEFIVVFFFFFSLWSLSGYLCLTLLDALGIM